MASLSWRPPSNRAMAWPKSSLYICCRSSYGNVKKDIGSNVVEKWNIWTYKRNYREVMDTAEDDGATILKQTVQAKSMDEWVAHKNINRCDSQVAQLCRFQDHTSIQRLYSISIVRNAFPTPSKANSNMTAT